LCGHVYLEGLAAEDISGENFTKEQKKIIGIYIRNEYERRARKSFVKPLTIENLHEIISQYHPLDTLEKMDNALLNLERASKFAGDTMKVNLQNDLLYYHCFHPQELVFILRFLCHENLTHAVDLPNPHNGLYITAKGYERLRELKRLPKDSRQCFVAMWLAPQMNRVYEGAIKPAIEYIENGEKQPSFEAIKIDNIEHTNDINDEIIAAIRRSRFMVCDLTGYRGGVYFEAGFAYGLGLEVIYTCRKDWTGSDELRDKKGNHIKELFDSNGKKIEVKKEGIHFDLEHRNRIVWKESDLKDFKDKLTKRIKAIIV
jgi:nucleoside 2-deoxyribosyltransferase